MGGRSFVFSLSLVALTLSACGKLNPPTQTTDLSGTWQSCANLTQSSARVTLAFVNGMLTATSESFPGNSVCSGIPNQIGVVTASYANGAMSSQSQWAVNLTLQSSFRSYGTEAAASLANSNRDCGIQNWRVGVQQSIDHRACASSAGVSTVPGAFVAMAYTVSGNVLDTDYPVYWDGLFRQPGTVQSTLVGVYPFYRK